MWHFLPWPKPVLMPIEQGFIKYSLNSFIARTICDGSVFYSIAKDSAKFFFFQSRLKKWDSSALSFNNANVLWCLWMNNKTWIDEWLNHKSMLLINFMSWSYPERIIFCEKNVDQHNQKSTEYEVKSHKIRILMQYP